MKREKGYKKKTQPSVLVKVKHLWRSEASIKYAHVPSSAFCKKELTKLGRAQSLFENKCHWRVKKSF